MQVSLLLGYARLDEMKSGMIFDLEVVAEAVLERLIGRFEVVVSQVNLHTHTHIITTQLQNTFFSFLYFLLRPNVIREP